MTTLPQALTAYWQETDGLRRCQCGKLPNVTSIPAHTHRIAQFMPDYDGGVFVECACGMAAPSIASWNNRPADRIIRELQERLRVAEEKLQLTEMGLGVIEQADFHELKPYLTVTKARRALRSALTTLKSEEFITEKKDE